MSIHSAAVSSPERFERTGRSARPGIIVTGHDGRQIWVPLTPEELLGISAASKRVARLYLPGGALFMPKGPTS
jgi:hypothetical protein